MAFFFTLLYIVAAFVSPPVLLGPIAEYHAEIIIALCALLSSIPNMSGSGLLHKPQTRAIFALWICLTISVSINTSFREGGTAFYNFVPATFTYFLTALNCKTKRHLQVLTLALLLSSLYFIIHGYLDLQNNVTPSLYLYGDEGLRRLRGLGLINDPNDFSQVMVSLVPCIFLFRQRNAFANVFGVGVPILILLTGLYLAHSRGAAVALMAIVILAARRKIGTLPAMIVAGTLFAGSLAIGWSGGRDVSMEAGADRLDAWVTGIEFIKAHPLFGIGNQRFGELNDITAHNSIIVCAAEQGLLGFICWTLFVVSSFRMGVRVRNATVDPSVEQRAGLIPDTAAHSWAKMLATSNTPETVATQEQGPPTRVLPSTWLRGMTLEDEVPTVSILEEQRMAQLFVFGLTGFLTAGWFLSRALSPWMFMYGGMLVAVQQMGRKKGLIVDDEPFPFLLRWAVIVAACLLLLLYVTLKIRKLMGQ